jgi:hypothetical protein
VPRLLSDSGSSFRHQSSLVTSVTSALSSDPVSPALPIVSQCVSLAGVGVSGAHISVSPLPLSLSSLAGSRISRPAISGSPFDMPSCCHLAVGEGVRPLRLRSPPLSPPCQGLFLRRHRPEDLEAGCLRSSVRAGVTFGLCLLISFLASSARGLGTPVSPVPSPLWHALARPSDMPSRCPPALCGRAYEPLGTRDSGITGPFPSSARPRAALRHAIVLSSRPPRPGPRPLRLSPPPLEGGVSPRAIGRGQSPARLFRGTGLPQFPPSLISLQPS